MAVQMQEWQCEYQDCTYDLTLNWDGVGVAKKADWVSVAADGFVAGMADALDLEDGDRITLKLTAPSSQCFKVDVLVQVEARALILGSVDVASDAL